MRFVFFVLMFFLVAYPAFAVQQAEGIAAVVNQDIVTTTDLKDRAEMLVKSSGKPASPDLIERVKRQVLEGLIAESIQLQESKKLGIMISDADVQDGFEKIAAGNNMTPEQFKGLLAKQNIRPYSIERQIKAQIGWGRVIQQVLRPRVIIGESEIKLEKERIKSASGKREFLTAEIFLPVSSAADDGRVRALAQTLAGEIKKGKPFSQVAQAQSQSASAAQGGMIGWIQEGQLEPVLDRALVSLAKDQLSVPVRGDDGYYLFFVRDVRKIAPLATADDAVLTIRALQIDTSGMREKDAKAEAQRIATDLTGCIDITKKAASDKRYKLVERTAAISELTAREKDVFGKIDIGRATAPEYMEGGAIINMVCSRSDPKGPMVDDGAIERKLGLQRLDLLQKRYLRDLIAAAYIERRI